MHHGNLVFDGPPKELTNAAVRKIYGAEQINEAARRSAVIGRRRAADAGLRLHSPP